MPTRHLGQLSEWLVETVQNDNRVTVPQLVAMQPWGEFNWCYTTVKRHVDKLTDDGLLKLDKPVMRSSAKDADARKVSRYFKKKYTEEDLAELDRYVTTKLNDPRLIVWTSDMRPLQRQIKDHRQSTLLTTIQRMYDEHKKERRRLEAMENENIDSNDNHEGSEKDQSADSNAIEDQDHGAGLAQNVEADQALEVDTLERQAPGPEALDKIEVDQAIDVDAVKDQIPGPELAARLPGSSVVNAHRVVLPRFQELLFLVPPRPEDVFPFLNPNLRNDVLNG